MKLTMLRIRNFRCYKSIEIQLGSMHALVGANNAGKSTVLRALDFLFNASAKRMNEESFFQRDSTLRIEIEGVFTQLSGPEKELLGPYLRSDDSFHMMRTAELTSEDGVGSASADEGEAKVKVHAYYRTSQPRIEWLNPEKINTTAIAAWWDTRTSLVYNGKSFAETLGAKKPSVASWKEAAAEFAATNLSRDDMEEFWIANPQGYAGVLKATLPHFELIPAVRDAADESKVTKTNPFGRLVYEVVRTLDAGIRDEVEAALRATTVRLNREGKNERSPRVADVESTIKDFLGEVMPVDLELEFQAPTIETVLTTPKILIDDGFRGSVDGKGHGLQRAVIFAILRTYAKFVTERPDRARRTLMLGVEEPELYMHPTAQRTIRRVLRAIANGGDQVIFSTHSPLMVDVEYFDEIIRIEGADGAGLAPRVRQLSVDNLIDDLVARFPRLAGSVTDQSIREKYRHAYTSSRNEGFFAKRVILVEGSTEVYALPIYASAMGYDLDALGVAVVESGGKNQMDRLFRIFNELGVVCYPIFDFDKSNTDKEVQRATKLLLSLFNRSDITNPQGAQVTDKFACFSEDFESDLRSETPDYGRLVSEARKELGDPGKPLIARFVATALCQQSPPAIPPTIRAIITNAVSCAHPGTCLSTPTFAVTEPESGALSAK